MSAGTRSFKDYVDDAGHMALYRAYQQRYARSIRESDRVLIEIIRALVAKRPRPGRPLRLLDVGCSTGNLLGHLKQALPGLALSGADIVSEVIAECRANPDLAGIQFDEMNVLNPPAAGSSFDLVVTNAALMFFDDDELGVALRHLGALAAPGGWFVAFDYFHPFEQRVALTETSRLHPHGLTFHLRPYGVMQRLLEEAGFESPAFRPFHLPIDLPPPSDPGQISSYTVSQQDGGRLCFRGTLYQPWCHLTAQRRR